MQYSSKNTSLNIDSGGQITFAGCPGRENLIRQRLPFARLAYFELRPAFQNEWIHTPRRKPPVYSDAVSACGDEHFLTIGFSDGAKAQFEITPLPEGIRFTVQSFQPGSAGQPAILRFAQLAPHTDRDSICLGMALNLKTDGADLPGICELLYAEAYFHFDIIGCAFILATLPRAEQRAVMQSITKNHTQGIPWLASAGAYADKRDQEIHCSYMMTYGAYMPGSLTPENIDAWIAMLKALGVSQVDFHGAEGKNFRFGDFEPYRPIFPEGRKSLRKVIDRLHANGIKAIMQTYSSLIDPNSSLVHPKPHPSLGYNRCFTLTADIDAQTKQIPIEEDTAEISLIHTSNFNSSRYVVWDDEVIEFTALGDHLLDQCVRGAFGTTPASHRKGTAGRNLKYHCSLFSTDIDGPLFKLVAKKTAECFNECDFDALYFDALEGVVVLEGSDLGFYYETKFVYEVIPHLKKLAGIEMSNMRHNLWYVRSRTGAWDRPTRAQKKFIERHAEVNRASQKKTLLPQNLGWWYLGQNRALDPVSADRITTDVYENMGRLGLANDFSLSFQGLTLDVFENCEEVRRFAEQIRRYEALRLAGRLSEEDKELLAGRECHLCKDGLYPANYLQAVAEFRQGTAKIVLDNPFAAQVPFIVRFEPLQSPTRKAPVVVKQEKSGPDTDQLVLASSSSLGAAETTAPEKEVPLLNLEDFASIRVLTSRTVTAEISQQQSPHGAAVCFTATAQKAIGCARLEQRFSPPLNIKGQNGFGVWIHGDGKSEVLNFQLRSFRLHANGFCEKLIRIDFCGWKYCSLIENGAAQVMEYLWPYYHRELDVEKEFVPLAFEDSGNDWTDSMYIGNRGARGNPCQITSEMPDFTRITVSAVWMNNLPQGETCSVKIAKWHSFFTEARPVSSLEMGKIRFDGTLPANSIAEFSDASWFTGDSDSRPLPVKISGEPEMLQAGRNTLLLKAQVPDGTRLKVVAAVMEEQALVKF